jgi:hypothetical protein
MTAPYEEYPHAQNDATTRPAQSEIETAPAQYMNYQLQPQPSTTGNTEIDLWEYGPVIPPPPPPDSLASITTQDQVAPIQPLVTVNDPITTASNKQPVSLKNIFIGILKSILYFFGMFITCVGVIGTSTAAGITPTIPILICLIAPVLVTILFYKRHYHLNTIKWQHYLWWILGSTIGALVFLILISAFADQRNTDTNSLTPTGSILFGLVFLFYGVILVITAFRKRSTTNSPNVPRRKKSRA